MDPARDAPNEERPAATAQQQQPASPPSPEDSQAPPLPARREAGDVASPRPHEQQSSVVPDPEASQARPASPQAAPAPQRAQAQAPGSSTEPAALSRDDAGQGGGPSDFKPYVVTAQNSPTRRFADAREAAQAFASIPVEHLPRVELRTRGTIEIGGKVKTKVSTTQIAATRLEGRLPVRRFTKAAPPEFREAVDAVREQLLAQMPAPASAMPVEQAWPQLQPEPAQPREFRAEPAPPAQPPRVQVGPDAQSFANVNAQAARELADRQGVTEAIERAFANGKTAAQVATGLRSQLAFVPKEERGGFVMGVRASLGIPSQADEEGRRDFARWKAGYEERAAAASSAPPVTGAEPEQPARASAAAAAREISAQASVPEAPEAGSRAQRQQPHNSIEAGAAGQRFDGTGRVAFSKRRTDRGIRVSVRIVGADGHVKSQHKGLTPEKLAEIVGETHAATILQARTSAGTLQGEEIQQPRQQAAQEQGASASVPAAPDHEEALQRRREQISASLAQRFDVKGNAYHFKGEPGRVAFVDKGRRLATERSEPGVARAMIDVAEVKGWQQVRLKGTEEFRRAAWMEAALRGMQVSGYQPTIEDRQRLAQRQQERRQAMQQEGTPPAAAPVQTATRDVERQREQLRAVLRASAKEQGLSDAKIAKLQEGLERRMAVLEAQGKALPRGQVYDAAAPRQVVQAPVQARPPQERTQRSR